jgi:hypothetical protein
MFKEYEELEFESRNELICTASNTTLAAMVISRKANVTGRIDIRRSRKFVVRGPACHSILNTNVSCIIKPHYACLLWGTDTTVRRKQAYH